MITEKKGENGPIIDSFHRLAGVFEGTMRPNERQIWAVCGILLVAIFFIDITLQIGFVVSILYVIPVMICIWSLKRRTVLVMAGVATLLTLVAVPLKPPGDILIPLFNRPVSLIALWTVAILVDRWKKIDGVRKQLELDSLNERESIISFLRLINGAKDTEALIKGATAFFQEQAGVEAVGIRLHKGEDFPYFETKGLPPEFVRAETDLCSKDEDGNNRRDSTGNPVLECMCGNVICGRFDPSKPFFTKNGSFWTNSTTELLAATAEADRQARTRKRCNGEGYESVAMIPLNLGNERLGLVQLNDRKKGRFDPASISKFERMAGYLAVAVAKFRTDDRLMESEAKYRNIVDNAQEGIMVAAPDGQIIFANERMAQLMGYTVEELVSKSSSELVPEVRGEVQQNTKGHQEGIKETYEILMQRKDGQRICMLASGAPIYDAQGRHTGNLGIYNDITERKNTERSLRESREDLNRAQAVAMTGSWRLDVKRNVLLWSDENHRIFGIPKGTPLTFETFLGTIHPDDREFVDREWGAALCGKPYDVEHRIIVGSEVKWVRERAELEFRNGMLQGGFGTTQDITKRKKAEKELQESMEVARMQAEKLARSNAELQQFAYVASHDLQEPLRMVTAYLGLLEKNYRDRLDDRALKYLDFAVDGGTRARELIRDLLDYSRIDSQAKPIQSMNMEEVMALVTNHLSIQTSEEHAIITHDPLPCILADKAQIANLLQNLISNAIKFHGEEEPRVHVSSEDKGSEWQFSIRDNGIGIDPEYKDKIFILFQRLHTAADYPGTGIGLAIAKKIVERHGGRIWFESEPGRGSTFYFTISKERIA